jgi:hypothetical protein
MGAIRRHLSYANVVATMALVLAMGGSALAANHYLISSTKQIKPSVLKKLKGAKGAAGKSGPQGVPGATGTAGPQGKAGAAGASNVIVRTAEEATKPGELGGAKAQCNPGERATGGGAAVVKGAPESAFYKEPGGVPYPNGAGEVPTSWTATWFNESGVETITVRVFVICASP